MWAFSMACLSVEWKDTTRVPQRADHSAAQWAELLGGKWVAEWAAARAGQLGARLVAVWAAQSVAEWAASKVELWADSKVYPRAGL